MNAARKYRLTAERIAAALNCDVATIHRWVNGDHTPPYFEPMCKAISLGLHPVNHVDPERLGIGPERLAYWKRFGAPMSVRMAMAGLEYEKPQRHHIRTLRNIDIGRYYRITNGYRSHRPERPFIRIKTADMLMQRGWIIRNERGLLQLTAKGKRHAYRPGT